MDFPEKLTEEEMTFRIKEWTVAGLFLEGQEWLPEGRHHGRFPYEEGKSYWTLFVYDRPETAHYRASCVAYVRPGGNTGPWTTTASWDDWNG